MTPDVAHPLPTSVLVTAEESSSSRHAQVVATALAARLNLPLHALPVGSDNGRQTGVDEDRSVDVRSALLVTAVSTTGRTKSRSQAGQHAGSSRRPWIAVGPNFRATDQSKPDQLVIAIDGSPEADAAVPTALCWAAAFDLAMHVVAVLPSAPDPPKTPTNADPQQLFRTDPERHIHRLLEDQPHPTALVKSDIVRDPIGVASALEGRLRHQADSLLVAPAERKRSKWTLVDGSSTNSLLRHSPVPVLLIPPRQAGTQKS